MNLKNEETIKKINELDEYWQKKCKEFENMEISDADAERWRASFRVQKRPIQWENSKSSDDWEFERILSQIELNIDVAIAKGRTNYKFGEATRFLTKYGTLFGAIAGIAGVILTIILSKIVHLL